MLYKRIQDFRNRNKSKNTRTKCLLHAIPLIALYKRLCKVALLLNKWNREVRQYKWVKCIKELILN